MSDVTDDWEELRECYQERVGVSPTLADGTSTVEVVPGRKGVDPFFVPGGIANNGQIEIQCLISDWTTFPTKGTQLTLADLPEVADGSYQTLSVQQIDGIGYITLGDVSAQS